jgi:hypothetical protein
MPASATLTTKYPCRSTRQATAELEITNGEVFQLIGHLRAGAGGQIQVVQLIDGD